MNRFQQSSLYAFALGCVAAATPEPLVEPDEPPAPAVVGFPALGAHEIDLLALPGRPTTLGSWSMKNDVLELERPHGYGANTWLAPLKEPMRDGVIRLTLRAEGSLRATVLFRTSVDEKDSESIDGYGLTINGTSVRFRRFEGGFARTLAVRLELPPMPESPHLEFVITAVGSLLTAQVFDADSLRPLGVITAAGSRFVTGGVGLQASPGVRFTAFNLARAGAPLAPDENALVGTRVVELEVSAYDQLPDSFEAFVADRDEARVVLRLGPVQYERLRRLGVEISAVTDQVPWRYIDPVYSRTREGEVGDNEFFYRNSQMIEDGLRALHESNPRITRLESLGKTASGKDIWALLISDNPKRREREPSVIVDGAQHGVELWATEYVFDVARNILERYPRDSRVKAWVEGLELWIVPLVNPDGHDAFMEVTHMAGRKNYRDVDGDGTIHPREGVDINRNFPFAWGRFGERGSRTRPHHWRFRGPEAASEPESQALMRLARKRQFSAALSVHTSGTVVLPPYATLRVKQPKLDEAWAVAEEMAAAAPRQLNGRRYRLRRRLYPVDGVWKDWLRYEFGTLAMVMEGPFHNPLDPSVLEQTIEESRPLWETLFDRTLLGPTVSGWVENEKGKPVAAEVVIVESAPRAGERWRARRADGFFVRYLVDDTPHTLRITARGYRPLEVVTNATTGPQRFVLVRKGQEAAH